MAGLLRRLFPGTTAQDEVAARQLTALRERASTNHLVVLHVGDVVQVTRRETKAWVTVDASGDRFDSWFWNAQVTKGQTVLASVSGGYGAHTQRDHILYVGREGVTGVHEVLPAGTRASAERHFRRQPVPKTQTPPSPKAAPQTRTSSKPPPKSVYALVPRTGNLPRVFVNGKATDESFKNFAAAVAGADSLRGGPRCWSKHYGKTCEAVDGHKGSHVAYKDGHSMQPFMTWTTDEQD